MTYTCEILEQPTQPTLSIRTRSAVQGLPQVLGNGYGAIMGYLGELGMGPAGEPFVIYYNMDMQDLDIELGFPVPQPLPGKGEIHAARMEAGKIATCLYVGPYADCGPAYEALAQFVKDQGYEASGVAIEYYLNDPSQPPYEEPKTRIVFPLKST
jgi:effector-binding domain-containing protein